jgi:CRISPR-associated endonuclease/helicase Cas3
MTLHAGQFKAFFRELWGQDPFPWQQRLAEQVCGGRWPDTLGLPTASGKTACLDIAIFALASQANRAPGDRSIGRRIFFVVNRRVIVDEATERANSIARQLRDADPEAKPVTSAVASALRRLSGELDAPPLDVAILRGGIYRDSRWARSVAQPTVITSTIDQIGSRLLFRGYGVSEAARPLHAALVAHDSLILLDEAHISQPFAQTLDAVRRYRSERWAAQPISTPFEVVQMTATPGNRGENVFRLESNDRSHPILAPRIHAAKPTELLCAGGKGAKALDELSKVVAEQAVRLHADGRSTVAIIVNRVATARKVYEILKASQEDQAEVHLAIGRMRPIDRDTLTHIIQSRVGKSRQQGPQDKPLFLVATQCLEVGADFDFDAMVSECASLDALRQRFGRLNRTGRNITAMGCIVIRGDQTTTEDDPIYGPALSQTWQWLESVAQNRIVDFATAAMEQKLKGKDLSPLLAPRANAPMIFPAYVDAWVQTSPAPATDPDVSLFLHGSQRGEPEVLVCWRNDLPEKPDLDIWTQIVGLIPPSSPECMPAPIGVVRAWLAGQDTHDEQRGDTLDASEPEVATELQSDCRTALAWRGPASRLVRSPSDIHPGETLVLPVSSDGWTAFGHIPGAADGLSADSQVDIAERAFRESHGRAVLRLTPSRLAAWPQSDALVTLKAWLDDPDDNTSRDGVRGLLAQIAITMPSELAREAVTLGLLADRNLGLTCERYPAAIEGAVLTTRRPIPGNKRTLLAMDEGHDETSQATGCETISLNVHTKHVEEALAALLHLVPVEPWKDALLLAARFHDLGKSDERFQALLINSTLDEVWAQPTLWAKSVRMAMSPNQRQAAYRRSSLPPGFRHEMLSVQLAESEGDLLPTDSILRDLALHLVSSHHGYGRPFAPVVIDDAVPAVSLPDLGITFTSDQRRQHPPHRLDSGIAERFWTLTRHFGWWGLAYLEAVLRLADQRASQREDDSKQVRGSPPATRETAT